jgi:lipopolysaccharide export system permease protein
VLYAREVVGDELHDVFLQTQRDDRVNVVLAARGRRMVDPVTSEQSFIFHDGKVYEGVPGQGKFLVVEFDEQHVPVHAGEEDERVELVAAKPTGELLRSVALADRAELHWRLSLPLSLIVLALLAVPLSRSSPREGRYGRLGIALFVYLIYTNLLSIGRFWIERGVVNEAAGMWWVHAVVGLLGLLLLARESGWFVRARVAEPSPA